MLTGEPDWLPSTAKASRIIHPAVRILHRVLVNSVYGRTEHGQMSRLEMKALKLGTLELNSPRRPSPINFAEKFIDQWLGLHKLVHPGTEIGMGGGITRLAMGLVENFSIHSVDVVSNRLYLNLATLSAAMFISPISGSKNLYQWLVRKAPWCILPNEEASAPFQGNPRPNPFYLTNTFSVEQQRPVDEPPVPQTYPSPPPPLGMPFHADYGMQLQDVQRTLGYHDILLRGLYSAGVNAGSIDPYLNYPHYPPQEGPLPGWHQNAPTYPYHPSRPEGIDYRYPGGTDPRWDPNIPPFTYPNYPPNYHSSVPPMEQTWGNAPMPPWGNYVRDPSSNMDED